MDSSLMGNSTSMGLPISFSCIVDGPVHTAMKHFSLSAKAYQSKQDYWTDTLYHYVAPAIGFYACLTSGQVGLAVLIGVLSAHTFRGHLSHVKAAYGPVKMAPYPIDVTIHDEGITEAYLGVTSIYTWSSMRRWSVVDGVLLIEMKNAAWLPITTAGLNSVDMTLGQITGLLEKFRVVHQVVKEAAL